MRRKDKTRRNHVILIRVNREEKTLAERLSSTAGENVSEFFRRLLREAVNDSFSKRCSVLLEKHKKILKEHKKILKNIK